VPKLHLGAGLYESNYSTFGSNFDGRLSAVYDTDPQTSLRFSVGTGFRAPLLIERYVFANDQLPPPDNNCVISGQGNPNERPEHATEYEVGASHQFGANATLDASLYRTNLRDPIENYYPGDTCPTVSYSYPINIGNAVYEGAELRYVQRFPRAHTFITAMYGLNVAYPSNMPATVSNPTSGAYIVNGEQFPNIPQQQASLEGDWDYNGWHAAAVGVFRGKNNPLNQPPVVFVDAALGHTFGHVDLTLAGTNLFNAAAGKFQIFNGGQPYFGITPSGQLGPLPTNLLTVEPAGVRLILTYRR
jgi:outer membrane receptor protein involved in Fe transport